MAVPQFDAEFYRSLADVGKSSAQFKWYLTAIVALGALNYPEEIPNLYKHLLEVYIPEPDRFEETKKIREGLTKVSGIMGAAKTGSALRALAASTPPELLDSTHYRASDTPTKAVERGLRMHYGIYSNIPGYDDSKTLVASPDYYHIVTKLFYGHIFSFNGILNDLETEQVVVSALLGIDCPEQTRNHMMAMLMNGASHEDLEFIRSIVQRLAERGGIQLRRTPVDISHL